MENKLIEKFTWIPIYKEIANKLVDYKNRQNELLEMIKEMKNMGLVVISLRDENPPKNKIELTEIDPFTFMANFNRNTKKENRLEIINYLKDKMNLTSDIPSDLNGIPIMNNQRSWFFSYKYHRKADDIPKLWDIFINLIKTNTVKEDDFNDIIKNKGIKFNITIGFFWVRPETYIPIDKNTRDYLKISKIKNWNYDKYQDKRGTISDFMLFIDK